MNVADLLADSARQAPGRDAIIAPGGLEWSSGDDELNRGRRKMTLSFELPKGSYATVLLKRLFHDAVTADDEEAD